MQLIQQKEFGEGGSERYSLTLYVTTKLGQLAFGTTLWHRGACAPL